MSWHAWVDNTDLTAAPYKLLNITFGIPDLVDVVKAGEAAGASLETYRGDRHKPTIQKLRIVVESTTSADDALTQADELALLFQRGERLRVRRTDTSPILWIDLRSVILGDPKPADQPQLEGAKQLRFDVRATTGPYWINETRKPIPYNYIKNPAFRYGTDNWTFADSLNGSATESLEQYNLFGVQSQATQYRGIAGDSAETYDIQQASLTSEFKGGDPVTSSVWLQGSFQGCTPSIRTLTINSASGGVDNQSTTLSPTNLFVNPSFEDQYGVLQASKVSPGYGWDTAETTSSAPLYSFIQGRKRDDKREGGQAVRIVHQHQAADADGAFWIEQETYSDDAASSDVVLSTYIANFIHAGAVLKHDVTFKDSSGATLSNPTNTITASASATSLDDDDARIQSTFTAPANTVRVLGRLIVEDLDANVAAQIDIDDFQLEVASTATEFKEWEKFSSQVSAAGVDVVKAQTGLVITGIDETDDFHFVLGGIVLNKDSGTPEFSETRVEAAPAMFEIDGIGGQVDALTELSVRPASNTTFTTDKFMIGDMTPKFGPTSRAYPILFFDDTTAAEVVVGARGAVHGGTTGTGGNVSVGALWDLLAEHGTLEGRYLLLARVAISHGSETWQVRFRNYFVIGGDQVAVNGEWVPTTENTTWETMVLGVAEFPPVSFGGNPAEFGENLASTIEFLPTNTGTLSFDTLTAVPVGQGGVIAGGPSTYAATEGIVIVEDSPLPRMRDVRKHDGTSPSVSVLDQTQELGRLLLAPEGNVLAAYYEHGDAVGPDDLIIDGWYWERFIIPAAAG